MVTRSFLADAAHVPGGYAEGVAFPVNEADVAALVVHATRVLPVGAQSSLTGGATPRGDVVLSTRALTGIDIGPSTVRAGAGVPLSHLQQSLAARQLYYPPAPTYDGAFVGGTIATNAAGPATFKYGSTRPWIDAITVVLASGDLLDLHRGEVTASPDMRFQIDLPQGQVLEVPVPTYTMPDVPKLSAGYYARPGMDLIDLFIGSEGTLGVVVDATLRLVALPRRSVVALQCASDAQAVAVTTALRLEAGRAWRGDGPLDVAAIEYMDARALRAVPDDVFARAGMTRPSAGAVLLLLQVHPQDDDAALHRLQALIEACGVQDDPVVAEDARGAQRLFEIREAVPATVNALVARAQERVHPEIQKTAADLVVPFERLAESLALYRAAFDARGLDYAIWGHVSDGNLHPNVVPRSLEDVTLGRAAVLEIAREVIAMGGAPLAEHGVGRSPLKQQLLRALYGARGIAEMRAVKRVLDPAWKLARGVLFSEADSSS